MRLLLLGAGMGVVGGLVPSPLHFIALTQVALNRWRRAIAILVGPPVLIDGILLVVTLFFFRYVPRNIAHDVAYAGGTILIAFGGYSLKEMRGKSREEIGESQSLTYASMITASLAEVTATRNLDLLADDCGSHPGERPADGLWAHCSVFCRWFVWLLRRGYSFHFAARLGRKPAQAVQAKASSDSERFASDLGSQLPSERLFQTLNRRRRDRLVHGRPSSASHLLLLRT